MDHYEIPSERSLKKVTRIDSVNASSRDKFLEILISEKFPSYANQLFMCLAESPGSMASALLRWVPSLIVIYNSLLDPENLPGILLGNYRSPETCCDCLLPESI
jgi:hypothetical protein